MNGQSHQRAPNNASCHLSPTASEFKAWQNISDRHLWAFIKRSVWGRIPAKPTVETNIIDVRLNFITLTACFLPTEKNQSAIFKVLYRTFSCWAGTCFWNNHATLVFFWPYKGHTQLPGRSFGKSSYLWDFLIIWKAQLDYCTPQPPYASLESTNPLLF